MERLGDVTFQGNPLTAIGPKLEVGNKAPAFQLLANDLGAVNLSDSAGKVRLVSVVPSLDTPVCDMQTRKFNEQLDALGERVVGYTVSADLPFAQARWCGAAGMKRMQTVSDHRDMAFGNAYGTHIKELRLESRAVFVIDGKDVVQHVEYVKEITQHPDYDAALATIKRLIA
jgi:thioredoxin-dependent peroxiredoxin